MASAGDGGFALQGRGGGAPPVQVGVQASGGLEGVLFTLCLRQTHRNAGSRQLEVVHTFPLPARSVLLGTGREAPALLKPMSA